MFSKKIIAFICILAIIFSAFSFGFCLSAYADSNWSNFYTLIDYWDLMRFVNRDDNLQDPLEALGIMRENGTYPGCNSSPDGNHYFHGMDALSPLTGFHLTCDYCGMTFSDYASGAYEISLEENNLTGVQYFSNGQIRHSLDLYYKLYSSDPYSKSGSVNTWWTYNIQGEYITFVLEHGSYSHGPSNYMYFYVGTPGTSVRYSLVVYLLEGSSYTRKYSEGNSRAASNSDGYINLRTGQAISNNYGSKWKIEGYYWIPDDSSASTQNFYTAINNINTTNFNLATVDNSQNFTNVYENTTVINNNNTTFTMPGGSSYPIDSWEFDFDNNRYTLVVLDGELEIPVTLKFGVDDLNINFDGDEYNYKYVTESAPHVHTWELTSSVDPTCTSSGSKTYTCSECNDVRTEVVPALDHDWMYTGTVAGYYYADLGSCACPECNSTNVSLASGGENHFSSEQIGVVCDDCGEEWTITGSYVAAYDTYICSRCQETKQLPAGEDLDNSDSGYWAWLRIWLNNFKTWLGEKLDALLDKENVIQFDPNIEITIPTADPGFVYADEDGNEDIWHPSSLKDKFAFWSDVRDIGSELYASVQTGGTAPELIIHLGNANSPYGFQYGGDEYAMDLSWYGQYKDSVDSITGGFLWLLYLYGVFKHLPEILSGVGMLDNRVEDIQSGTKGGRRRNG